MQAPAAALLAVLVLVLLPLPASAATYSSLWGKDGNDWDPRGRLPDFSYAGVTPEIQACPLLPQQPALRYVLHIFAAHAMSHLLLCSFIYCATRVQATSTARRRCLSRR